jgi:hypothetical protein
MVMLFNFFYNIRYARNTMAKSFFSRDYHKKREKLTDLVLEERALTNKIAVEFFKSISVDYVNSLRKAIKKFGIPKYQTDFESFCEKFNNGVLENGDFAFFETMQDLYGERIAELQDNDSSEDE